MSLKGVVMGQAAVDLPDPLEPPPVSAASTDDLLAQFAGEEIDRLLAQDEGAPTPAPAGASKQPAEPVDAASVPSQRAAPEPTTGAQLNDLLTELESRSPKDPVAPAPAATAPAATAPESQAPSDLLEDDETRAAERGALGAPVPTDASSPIIAPADAIMASEDAPPLDPLYVRILEAINAPLAACSDEVRAALGKIAILTAVNSLAVLIYVCFFRHH
jgi:hypothetical protein